MAGPVLRGSAADSIERERRVVVGCWSRRFHDRTPGVMRTRRLEAGASTVGTAPSRGGAGERTRSLPPRFLFELAEMRIRRNGYDSENVSHQA